MSAARFIRFLIAVVLAGAHAAPSWAQADDPPVRFSGSGFATIAAGRVTSGAAHPESDNGFRCPCNIADYGQGSLYQGTGWRAGPDSRLGLQGSASSRDGRLAVTGQVVMRGSDGGAPRLEWLYATGEIDPDWTVQVGRKRLPLLASSEVQDVGYAIPWIRLPPQVYGWEIVNYNGASVTHRQRIGPWAVQVGGFAGSETVRDSRFQQLYSGPDSRTDTRWSRILGTEGRATLGGLELRGVYVQSDAQYRYASEGEEDFGAPKRQKLYALGAAYDDMHWVIRAEAMRTDRRFEYGGDRAWLVGLGRRHQQWLGLVTYARYRQNTWASGESPEGHDTLSLTIRRELGPRDAIKLQVDRWFDRAGADFPYPHGNSRLVSVAYVAVF